MTNQRSKYIRHSSSKSLFVFTARYCDLQCTYLWCILAPCQIHDLSRAEYPDFWRTSLSSFCFIRLLTFLSTRLSWSDHEKGYCVVNKCITSVHTKTFHPSCSASIAEIRFTMSSQNLHISDSSGVESGKEGLEWVPYSSYCCPLWCSSGVRKREKQIWSDQRCMQYVVAFLSAIVAIWLCRITLESAVGRGMKWKCMVARCWKEVVGNAHEIKAWSRCSDWSSKETKT